MSTTCRRASRAFALLLAAAFPMSGLASQPNVLLIIADDIGVDLISTYVDAGVPAEYPQGYTVPQTPTIEALAATGVTFTNAWASPSCSPTRATILTGQFGFRNGVHWPIGGFTPPGTPSQLDVDNPYLLPKLMKQAGYATALTGKWHMTRGPGSLDDPGQAGFDNSWGPQGGAVPNFYNWNQLVNEVDPLTGEIAVSQQQITTYVTSEDVDIATDWIEEQAMVGKPWFLWAAFVAPHLPAFQKGHFPPASLIPASRTDGIGDDDCNGPPGNIPQDASDQLIRNCYEAGMEALDAEMARLLNEIDLLGHLDNTVVIFIGDNGTDHPAVLDPVDSQHAKGTVYLQGVQVPFIINTPDTASSSRMAEEPVHTVDLYQTILDFAGTPYAIPPSVPIDSVTFQALLLEDEQGDNNDQGNRRKTNFAEGCVPFSAPGWALNPAFFTFPPHDGQTITDNRYKLIDRTLLDDNAEPILDYNGQEQRIIEFYDIENDPYELTNLIQVGLTGKEQSKFKKLKKDLEELTGGRTCSDWRADIFGS